jgi:hypothetical protein
MSAHSIMRARASTFRLCVAGRRERVPRAPGSGSVPREVGHTQALPTTPGRLRTYQGAGSTSCAGFWDLGKAASMLPGSGSFVLAVARAAGGCGERETMISTEWRPADSWCSPYRPIGAAHWWVHPTDLDGVERSSTDLRYQTLTCQNDVSAGQQYCPGNFDTEAVGQRASTALNCVKPQVNGTVEGNGLSCVEGEHFPITEVRPAPQHRAG